MEQTLFWTVSVFVYIYPYFYYFSNSLLFLVSETFFLRSLFFSGSSFRNSLSRDLLVVNCLSFKWTVISFTVSFCAVGLPTTTRGCRGKESTCQYRRWKRCGFDPWARKIPWSRKWQPAPVFLLENSMDRKGWRATVNGVAKRWTQLSNWAHRSVQRHVTHV